MAAKVVILLEQGHLMGVAGVPGQQPRAGNTGNARADYGNFHLQTFMNSAAAKEGKRELPRCRLSWDRSANPIIAGSHPFGNPMTTNAFFVCIAIKIDAVKK